MVKDGLKDVRKYFIYIAQNIVISSCYMTFMILEPTKGVVDVFAGTNRGMDIASATISFSWILCQIGITRLLYKSIDQQISLKKRQMIATTIN